MKAKIFGLLIAAGSLLVVACSRNWEGPDSDAEEVDVTFSLSAEGGMASSRAGEPAWKISDGTQVDQLVYAVYVKEADSYKLLKQYGDDVHGQTVLTTDKLTKEGGETITLRLMRGQEYTIGFWAQNSNCKAYDATDLEAVKVDYTGGEGVLAPNNDETRDAFCQVYSFTAQVGVTQYVTLKRAMAQINVGTAGWDYNAEVDYPNLFAYSKIEIKGLYDQLNVLTGEVAKTDAVKDKVTYDWAKLPAHIRRDYPAPSEDFAEWLKDDDNNDEYLRVKLTTAQPTEATKQYFDDKYLKYLTTEPTKDSYNVEGVTTEVFKYLSMCYVLAPTYDPDAEDSSVKGGTTIEALTFYLAETPEGTVRDYLGNPIDASERFTIRNVPVQRNWRTNILGGTRGKETTLFDPRSVSLLVDISPGFDGDHNYDEGKNQIPSEE